MSAVVADAGLPARTRSLAWLRERLQGDFGIQSRTDDDRRWLVWNDPLTAPVASYLFDRDAMTLTRFYVTRPELEGAPLQVMHAREITARDGLVLPSYLTLPPGCDPDGDGVPQAPVPMVLFVHGGPWARDGYGFNPRHQWLANRGLDVPFYQRYTTWIGNIMTGDLGFSYEKNRDVGPLLWDKLKNTGILAFWVFALMIPISLILGVLSGMREGSKQDRFVSFISVFFTSIPEIATAILLTVILSLGLGWVPAKAAMISGFDWKALVLPVLTLVVYDFGYVARMTRASMAEVMTSQYIRTALLKGVSFRQTVMKHALRNALIAPFTVIMLQFPWLLTGVVIVENMFRYQGFGYMLVQAAANNDIDLLLACGLVSVVVVLATQLISDVGYAFLNPRIRVS